MCSNRLVKVHSPPRQPRSGIGQTASMKSGAQPTLAHVAAGVSNDRLSFPSRSPRAVGGDEGQCARLQKHLVPGEHRAKSFTAPACPTAAVIFDPLIVSREVYVDTYWAQYMNSMILTASESNMPSPLCLPRTPMHFEGHQLDVVLFRPRRRF